MHKVESVRVSQAVVQMTLRHFHLQQFFFMLKLFSSPAVQIMEQSGFQSVKKAVQAVQQVGSSQMQDGAFMLKSESRFSSPAAITKPFRPIKTQSDLSCSHCIVFHLTQS